MLNQLKNKPIIINTDLDGIISGLFLKKYLKCKIVGFSNSAEKIWLQSDFTNFKNACFVDMYVANPNVICIEQHIISVNKKHHNKLKNNPKKINPNLINKKFFLPDTSYYTKYPFGTIHFLIALLEKKGFNLSKINPTHIKSNIQLIDLILRADDTMNTTVNSNYIENAKQWWQWLQEFSNNGKMTLKLKKYLNTITKEKSIAIKQKIAQLLQSNPFNCDSPDGGIKEITENGYLKDNVKAYFNLISEFLNTEQLHVNKKYKVYKGITKRLSLTNKLQEELIDFNTINNHKIFSYAFVRSSKRDYSFSGTFYQKND